MAGNRGLIGTLLEKEVNEIKGYCRPTNGKTFREIMLGKFRDIQMNCSSWGKFLGNYDIGLKEMKQDPGAKKPDSYQITAVIKYDNKVVVDLIISFTGNDDVGQYVAKLSEEVLVKRA